MSRATHSMAPLRPPRTPQELRDRMISDYRRRVIRMGGDPDMKAIERLALADLALVDAYEREKKRASAPRRKVDLRKRERPDPLKRHLAEHNLILSVTDPKPDKKPGLLDMPAHLVGPRWSCAVARIMRILQPRSDLKKAASGGLESMVKEAAYPKLAREFVNLWCNFVMRHIPRKHNPFEGLSDQDAARKFVRGVEDICDRSTAEPGLRSWYTK